MEHHLQRIDLENRLPHVRHRFDWTIWWRCTVRILVVTDASGNFGTTAGFGLGRALAEVAADEWPHVVFDITTAHRGGTSADLQNFAFDAHDLSDYHQIWLFGVLQEGVDDLSASELRAIAEFMDGGGGVFATGDHEDLGAAMCGQVPRVGSMRRWYYPNPGPNGEPVAPAQTGADRHDTLTDDPSLAGSPTQTDPVPQVIRPRYYHAPHPWLFARRRYPHPVLCGPDGVITHLPDHMHEGVIEVPGDLTRTVTFDGYSTAEYPEVDGHRQAPEVIAWATNTVTNEEFGVLGAYDGHRVGVGRVVVDATWHHWFNINMDPYRNASDPGHPTYDPATVPKWEEIKAYMRNVAAWLCPPALQTCMRNNGWLLVLRDYEVLMTIRDIRRVNDRLEYFWQVGVFARDALGRVASQCQSLTWTLPWFAEHHRFLEPWVPVGPPFDDFRPPLIDREIIEAIALGGALHELRALVDEVDLDAIPELIEGDERLLEVGRRGAERALGDLGSAYQRGAEWFDVAASAD